MGVEQKPGAAPKHPPGYPHSIKEVAETTKESSATVRRQIDRDIRVGFHSLTDPNEHVWLSDTGRDLVVEGLMSRKNGESATPSNGNTKTDPKSSRMRQARETPIPAPKKDIILPNGERIEAENETLAIKAIRGAISAKKNGTPYLARDIAELVTSTFNNQDGKRKVNLVVSDANLVLGQHGSIFDPQEVVVNGKKDIAFEIIEKKPTTTFSPEQKSPEG